MDGDDNAVLWHEDLISHDLQDERNEGITPPYNKVFHGIQPHATAKKLIAGGHQSDSQVKRKTRWNPWKVRRLIALPSFS